MSAQAPPPPRSDNALPRGATALDQTSFIEQAEVKTGADLSQFVKDEFDAFLECVVLAHGFLPLRCGDCGHHKLLAFSCKRRGTDGAPAFVELSAPTDAALQAVLHKIITRTMKMLTRRGMLVEEEGSTCKADHDGDSGSLRRSRNRR